MKHFLHVQNTKKKKPKTFVCANTSLEQRASYSAPPNAILSGLSKRPFVD
jgi:hypothetical protein